MIYDVNGAVATSAYNVGGNSIDRAYDVNGQKVYPDLLPIPTGTLTASSIVSMPDIYGTGHGFTCTGLCHDAETDTYLVGDIGKELPSSTGFASQIVRLSADFTTVVGTIPLAATFPNMTDIQGIAIDTSDGTIWFCSHGENLVRHITANGSSIGSFALNRASGISYDPDTDTLWCCTTAQYIYNLSKSGAVISSYQWSGSDTLDQCFYDYTRHLLYFDGGDSYSSANNLYCYDPATQTVSVACVLSDSYSVEGISLEPERLVIVNDGYYHSAATAVNQANIYNLGSN